MEKGTLSPAVKNALAGQPVSEGSLKGVVKSLAGLVQQGEKKNESLKAKKDDIVERATNTGHAALNFVELQGAAYGGGLAEGYFGEKVRPGGYDLRAIGGLMGEATGLYLTWKGSKAACHVLAPARGLVASAVVSAGLRHGAKIGDKSAAKSASQQQGAQVQIPADAKPGDQIQVKQADGSTKIGTVVQQADGSLGIAFSGRGASSRGDYREVELPTTLMSPSCARRRQQGRRGPRQAAQRGGKYPRPRR